MSFALTASLCVLEGELFVRRGVAGTSKAGRSVAALICLRGSLVLTLSVFVSCFHRQFVRETARGAPSRFRALVVDGLYVLLTADRFILAHIATCVNSALMRSPTPWV